MSTKEGHGDQTEGNRVLTAYARHAIVVEEKSRKECSPEQQLGKTRHVYETVYNVLQQRAIALGLNILSVGWPRPRPRKRPQPTDTSTAAERWCSDLAETLPHQQL